MKYLIMIVLFLSSAAIAKEKNNTRILSIGESTLIYSPPNTPLRIQKKGIVSLKDKGSQIIVIGKKLGQTKIITGPSTYTIKVIKKKRYRTWINLRQWLKNKRGPQISIEQNTLFLKGRILTTNDFISLANFLNEQSDFQLKATISPSIQHEIKQHIHSLLKHNNLFPGKLSFSPCVKMLISQNHKKSLTQYKRLLAPYGIQVLSDPHSYDMKPVVQIKLHIAHVKRSFFRNWGMKWPGEFTVTVAPSSLQMNNFSLSLQSLETNGLGRVLASPTLIAESGKTAHFHSGGEFPVRTTSQFSNSIHWKPYGLFLKVTPKANTNGSMQISIETELSAIDKSVATDGVPGMIRSKVQTTLNMEKPHPVLLSGLLQTDSNNNREGLAWLSQIPILQPLFSRGEVYSSEYELVFILSPSLLR